MQPYVIGYSIQSLESYTVQVILLGFKPQTLVVVPAALTIQPTLSQSHTQLHKMIERMTKTSDKRTIECAWLNSPAQYSCSKK